MIPDDDETSSEAEMLAAFAEYQLHKANKWDDAAGYDKDDPKHPDWAERMADKADELKMLRKERGNG